MSKSPPYPYIKWLGGKGRMAGHVMARLPREINVYGEPMIGGGAVLIELARQKRFKSARVADSNPELIRAWKAVKESVDPLVKKLREKKFSYDKELFLQVRATDPSTLDDVEAAARFIYLNRTCFNGIYRVNKKGEFNVPFGRYTDPLICDEPNLRAVSSLLKNVTIDCLDFADFLDDFPAPGDHECVNAVYADPPYVPVSKTANFTSYTEEGFGDHEHRTLAAGLRGLSNMRIRVVASNSGAKEARALYDEHFDVDELRGSRSVGGDGTKRKAVAEIIAYGGPKS